MGRGRRGQEEGRGERGGGRGAARPAEAARRGPGPDGNGGRQAAACLQGTLGAGQPLRTARLISLSLSLSRLTRLTPLFPASRGALASLPPEPEASRIRRGPGDCARDAIRRRSPRVERRPRRQTPHAGRAPGKAIFAIRSHIYCLAEALPAHTPSPAGRPLASQPRRYARSPARPPFLQVLTPLAGVLAAAGLYLWRCWGASTQALQLEPAQLQWQRATQAASMDLDQDTAAGAAAFRSYGPGPGPYRFRF